MQQDDDWQAGRAAAQSGKPLTGNPYDGRSAQGRAWRAGWFSLAQGEEPMARERVEYYQARESFVTMLNGEPVQVSAGDLVHPDHPILKGRGELFQPAKDYVRFNVEQATAAPGEKRGQ